MSLNKNVSSIDCLTVPSTVHRSIRYTSYLVDTSEFCKYIITWKYLTLVELTNLLSNMICVFLMIMLSEPLQIQVCVCVTEIGALDNLPSSVTSDELANP